MVNDDDILGCLRPVDFDAMRVSIDDLRGPSIEEMVALSPTAADLVRCALPRRPRGKGKRTAGRKTAARMRALRRRQRAGQIIAPCVIDEHVIAAAMIASGRLSERDALDRKKFVTACSQVLADWAARWPRDP